METPPIVPAPEEPKKIQHNAHHCHRGGCSLMLLLCYCTWWLVLWRSVIHAQSYYCDYKLTKMPTNLRVNPEVCHLRKVVSIHPTLLKRLFSTLHSNPSASNSSSSKTVCFPLVETHKSRARSMYETIPSSNNSRLADIAVPAFYSSIVAVMDGKDVVPAIRVIIFDEAISGLKHNIHERHIGAVEQGFEHDRMFVVAQQPAFIFIRHFTCRILFLHLDPHGLLSLVFMPRHSTLTRASILSPIFGALGK